MIINVEQRDIDEGRRLDCFRCPVATAIKRVLLYGYHCTVTQTSICILADSRVMFDCGTPLDAFHFINRFDFRQEVKPFSFYLGISSWLVKREWWLKSKKELTEDEAGEFYDILFWKQDL